MRCALLVLSLFAACASPPARGQLAVVERRLIDTIPETVNVVIPAAYSRDGRHAAFIAQTPEGDFAVCGAWTGKTYAVV